MIYRNNNNTVITMQRGRQTLRQAQSGRQADRKAGAGQAGR